MGRFLADPSISWSACYQSFTVAEHVDTTVRRCTFFRRICWPHNNRL